MTTNHPTRVVRRTAATDSETSGCGIVEAFAQEAAVGDSKGRSVCFTSTITVLVDDHSTEKGLQSEHGLSLWIEYAGCRILFDTGKSSLLTQNAETLGVDLASTQIVVLSHGHYDHTGGLAPVLKKAPLATVCAHPASIGIKYSNAGDVVRSIGMSYVARGNLLLRSKQGRVLWTEEPTEVLPGFFTTGTIPRRTSFEDVGGPFFLDWLCHEPDPLTDDQAAFFTCRSGLVVLLGCAHSGVVNTLDYVAELTGERRIYAVIGGMHLSKASPDRISRTVEAFRKYKVELVMPAHCTGQRASSEIRNRLAAHVITSGTGQRMEL